MTNSINGFRFSDGYEDVFQQYEDEPEVFTYVEAEPFMWADCMACVDYRANGDGTYSVCSAWYGTSVSSLTGWMSEMRAPMDVAAVIVGAEFARAYYFEGDESDLEEWAFAICDVSSLLDVAACHTLDTPGAPDVFKPANGESYSDFYGKWREAFRASGMDAVC